MDETYTNMSCRLYGTPHCRLLNSESCAKCYVAKLHPEEQEMVREDIRLIADNIPEDGLETLSDSETCCLCKGKNKNRASYYAHFTLAHLNPLAADMRFGRREYRRDVSMTIPVQVAACGECRRRVLVNTLVPLFVGVLVAALGLILVSLESVRALLVRGGRAIPFLVFLIFVFLGIISEALLKSKFTRELERHTYVRHSRLPAIGEMIRRGWIDLSEDDDIAYTFSKRPLGSGILTGENRAELISQIRNDETIITDTDIRNRTRSASEAGIRSGSDNLTRSRSENNSGAGTEIPTRSRDENGLGAVSETPTRGRDENGSGVDSETPIRRRGENSSSTDTEIPILSRDEKGSGVDYGNGLHRAVENGAAYEERKFRDEAQNPVGKASVSGSESIFDLPNDEDFLS